MVRECLFAFAIAFAVAPLAGCSLILNFSDNQVPIDAMTDAPYTQDECDYKEPNDSVDTAQVVTTSDSGPAAICAGETDDHDFYKFTVPANTSMVQVKITFMNRPSGDLDLKLESPTGTMIAQSRGFGNDETITCPAASPSCPTLTAGDYVFEVFGALPGSVNDYQFSLTLTPM